MLVPYITNFSRPLSFANFYTPCIPGMASILPIGSAGSSDDDGREKRTGTVWTASAHIVTAVIGPAALSLGWSFAELGWVASLTAMLVFSILTCYSSVLLANCYQADGDPVNGRRNNTLMDVVRSHLGGFQVKLGGWFLLLDLLGVAIRYTTLASEAQLLTKRTDCSHGTGRNEHCHTPTYQNTLVFGIAEIILSQIPCFDKISWLSTVAAVLSFTYPTIGLGLGIAKIAENGKFLGSITGVSIGTVTLAEKIWRCLQALGAIAFVNSFSTILIEIQDTLKSPSETKTMTRAILISEVAITLFNMLCGCIAYAAFGDLAPKNVLTEFGFYNLYWLLNSANAAMFIHLIIAYQVNCQPLFKVIEKSAAQRFPDREFEVPIPGHRPYNLSLFRLVCRTGFVIITTIISMLFPFDDVAGLLSVLRFWLFTVYFPVEIYIKQKEILTRSTKWWCLKILSGACLIFTIVVAVGSVAGVIYNLKNYKLFATRP